MKIILIGIQGSGKSTQGNLLSEKLGIPYLSAGHIFRILSKQKTPLGHQVKVVMNAGFLIPNEKTLKIVEDYLEKNNVPQNALHKQGFVSIGCAPCTRAITADEDIRAGRWWWESSHKECGLHQK